MVSVVTKNLLMFVLLRNFGQKQVAHLLLARNRAHTGANVAAVADAAGDPRAIHAVNES
jgi:hypothetical protein